MTLISKNYTDETELYMQVYGDKAVLFLCLNLQNNNNLTMLKKITYETEEQDLYSYA